MKCQMPGCKNKGNVLSFKNGIFSGIHIENVVLTTCGRHLEVEVDRALVAEGEREAMSLQEVNPFIFAKTA